ncbi:uncharacterized protein LOC110719428 [Chenopodium quinoa]|uniref:uncharacterized protein LOC110719428 n=1 Tax=Chenopodium quinoa TaxID=63459 RepID=UPI000B793ADB|nr:uncharacterized protein LOC110719428 [Chenopodium quinoa]
MLKLLASYDKDVCNVVMDNAPQNAKYTSPAIQKEILQVFANKVQKEIREEISDSKCCIIVDESRDISKREQMAIVLRFVDKDGYLRERFFELVHVKDTTSKTLKEEISMVLSNHELSIQNLRGQGYDGASNMRGEWNGLKDFFMEECRYAYYVHYGLCRALQHKSQDILNDMHLVVGTKSLIQNYRDNGWESLLQKVQSFCLKHDTQVLDMQVAYSEIIRSRRSKDTITVEHHYQVDAFNAVVDQQLQELTSRFSERTTKLLTLKKYYPEDFLEYEKSHLKYQLQQFYCDVPNHPNLKDLSTITDLCRSVVNTRKSVAYPLVDRLIRLILTLPVSTTTTERAFSAIKIVKTSLRNKMEDDFLSNYLLVYIEKEIAGKFEIKSIIDDFYSMKPRRTRVK